MLHTWNTGLAWIARPRPATAAGLAAWQPFTTDELLTVTVNYIITCVVITIMSYEEGEEQKRDGDERTRLIAIYLK